MNGISTPELQAIQITEDPGWPRVASDALEPLFQAVYAEGAYVTIRCGSDIRVRGTKPALEKISQVQVTE